MSLKDYCKTRDKFEMDPRLSVCSACRHWSIGKRNEPCLTCDHNANAAPAPEVEPVKPSVFDDDQASDIKGGSW